MSKPPHLAIGVLCLLAACAPAPAEAPIPSPAGGPPAAQATLLPPADPALPPAGYYLQPGLPADLLARIVPVLNESAYVQVATPEEAAVSVMLDPGPAARLTAVWVYALAAPFPTVPDGLGWPAFLAYWRTGDAAGLPFAPPPGLTLTPDVADMLIARLGPAGPSLPLIMGEAAGLPDLAWAQRPSLTVIPFEALEPRWKVLALDGQSPLDKTLDAGSYPLSVPIGLVVHTAAGERAAINLANSGAWPQGNRDPALITSVVLTGTTVVDRSVAMQVELNGTAFPSEKIRPFLADADLVHTSNESSYALDCPEPDWYGRPDLTLCSKRAYFEVLKLAGVGIVEATGNHINDFGPAAFENTLNVYDVEGMAYYGGGRTLAEATTPRVMSLPDGSRVAFVGCNSAGPPNAYASAETAGAAPCADWADVSAQIAQLQANDEINLVIATLQYLEIPSYEPSTQQIADFGRLAAAGADIVSGSQAHQPQGFAFVEGRFIHYGMGNLIFDQPDIENREMFADKHVLYDGRHIATILFTGIIEEWSQPRPMTPDERAAFLEKLFAASGW